VKTTFSLILLALLLLASGLFAKEPCCWINETTGKPQPSAPQSGVNFGGSAGAGVARLSPDGKSATNSRTGESFAKTPEGCWVNEQTGKPQPSAPQSGVNFGGSAGAGVARLSPDGKSATNSRTGESFVRVPCPPPDAAQSAGHAIQQILQHVSIGVGGGTVVSGGHDHKGDHHTTSQKRTGSTTGKKTVTAGCKCHPCTCSPCTCH
jgi:hypothetical protein